MESIGQKSKERKLGKTINFGFIFGAGANTVRKQIAYQIGIVLSDQQSYHAKDTYYDLYNGFIGWCGAKRQEAEYLGYTTTPLGKRRKLVPNEVFTKAINCPVQGGAAEVMMVALVVLFHEIRKQNLQKYMRISATVHDSGMLFALKGYGEKANELATEACKKGMLCIFPTANVKKISEGGVGANWNEI